MRVSSRFVFRSLSAGAFAASLGFGVQQAVAAPAAAAPAALACGSWCEDSCLDLGFDYGRCSGETCKCGRSTVGTIEEEPPAR